MQQFPARVKVVRATTVRALCVRVCVLGGVRGMPPTAYHPHALIVEPLKNLSCLVWLAGKIADIATAKPMPLTEANFILEYSYTPTPTPIRLQLRDTSPAIYILQKTQPKGS